jgi:hypothetical protein
MRWRQGAGIGVAALELARDSISLNFALWPCSRGSSVTIAVRVRGSVVRCCVWASGVAGLRGSVRDGARFGGRRWVG